MGARYRKATPSDLPELLKLSRLLARETKERAAKKTDVRRGLLQVLKGLVPDARIFVAESGTGGAGQLAGYLTVSGCEWSEWKGGLFLLAGSAYVRKRQRKSGVARELYMMAVKYARSRQAIGIRASARECNSTGLAAHQSVGLNLTGYVLTEHVF